MSSETTRLTVLFGFFSITVGGEKKIWMECEQERGREERKKKRSNKLAATMIALMIIWHIKTPKITTHLVMKLFYEQFAFQLDIIVLFCKTNLRLGFASKWLGSSIHCISSIWRNAFTGVRDIITPVCGVPNSTAMKLLTNKRLTLNNRKYSTKFSTILFFINIVTVM